MKIKNVLIAAVSVAILSSCSVTMPFAVTNNEIGSKTGTSKTKCFFTGMGTARIFAPVFRQGAPMYNGIMSNKNFGVVEAAKNGKITKIGAVDIKVTPHFFWVEKEFIVSGE